MGKLLIFTLQNLLGVHFLLIKYLNFSWLEEVHFFFLYFLAVTCKIHLLIRSMQRKVNETTSYFKFINRQKLIPGMESG